MDEYTKKWLQGTEDEKPVLRIVGKNGNAFNILGLAHRVAGENNMDWETIQKEATSVDYNNLLQVMMKYFDVR